MNSPWAPLCDAHCVSNERACLLWRLRKEENSGKHAPNYCVPHFRKKEITNASVSRTTSLEKKSEEVTNLATAGLWRAFTLHMLCVFDVSSVAMTPVCNKSPVWIQAGKKRPRNNWMTTPSQTQSAGQERVFRSRAGVSWWSQGRSAPLISRKRLQGEATDMFHKHVAVLQLHFVHFLLLKQEKKKI